MILPAILFLLIFAYFFQLRIPFELRPFVWLSIALIVYRYGTDVWYRRPRKWQLGETPVQAGVMVALLQIAFLIFAGILYKFGRSPYSFTPSGLLLNSLYVVSTVAGFEFSRAYIVKRFFVKKKRKELTVLILVAVFFTFLSIPPTKYGISNPLSFFKFLGMFISILAQNIFATFLALVCGASASIAYMGTLKAFEFFSPILPDVPWIIKSLISTLTPAVGYLASQQEKDETKEEWLTTMVAGVLIFFFFLGLFPVHPAVIGSGSMRPALDVGDIVIVLKTDQVREGDIVQYRTLEGFTITHRVIDIERVDGGIAYITKGDANEKPDPPVSKQQIVGKVVAVIPKVGWIGIILKDSIKILIEGLRVWM